MPFHMKGPLTEGLISCNLVVRLCTSRFIFACLVRLLLFENRDWMFGGSVSSYALNISKEIWSLYNLLKGTILCVMYELEVEDNRPKPSIYLTALFCKTLDLNLFYWNPPKFQGHM